MRVVTIDGPAGAGKSTVARRVADCLGWRFLDTGAMYRAVALEALRRGVDLESREALGALAAALTVRLEPGRVMVDRADVTRAIRAPAVTRATSVVADNPAVRARLAGWQREFAAAHDTVTEGRDQGTLVFPDAFRKFFLTATLAERARRRHAEGLARGDELDLDQVLLEIRERDARDEARAIAPLRPAADALVIDTTGLSLEEVVARLIVAIEGHAT
jgi:cytidylate kinase